MNKETKRKFKPILWSMLGAILSLFILCPLIIALLKYDRINHSQPLSEIIISAYKYFILEIDFDKVLIVLIFFVVGGALGYLFYYLTTSLNNKEKHLSLEDLLEKGESETVEFKSSLRWDYRQNKTNKELEFAILKTIVAFMNTQKGTLMIGVSDGAAIIGLDKDYQSLKRKNRDGFEQHLMELVALNIGTDCCKSIRVTFFEIERHDVCIVEVSNVKIPVYLKFQGNTFFYVRTGNHTRELNIEEAIKYINKKKSR